MIRSRSVTRAASSGSLMRTQVRAHVRYSLVVACARVRNQGHMHSWMPWHFDSSGLLVLVLAVVLLYVFQSLRRRKHRS